MHFETRAIHAGYDPFDHFGAVNPPVFLSSTFAQSAPGKHQGFEYARSGNPTRKALEGVLASIEGGEHACAFSSGLGATDSIIKLLSAGDHCIVADDVYGGTFRIFDKTFKRFGIEFSFVDTTRLENVRAAFKPNTKMLFLETPSNPLLKVSDIAALTALAREKKAITVVDNTFATPYLQRPLELGADIVMHSCTKYLGGHSDVVMGAAITRDEKLHQQIAFNQNASGAVPGGLDCYLVHRGIKTLGVRVEKSCDNAEQVVSFLLEHKRVTKIFYPALEQHVNHDVAARQMRRFGAMISFEIDGSVADGVKVVSDRKVWTLGESLGGVESLLEHPASMTHASIPKEMRAKAGLNDGLIRLSVGIEDPRDLIEDLKNGLESY
ncbi:MAG: aminotransferase class I/II-fold pyridoxal phosphate-dependent enzyme [Planctomycetes bacterium]|nr:aminotransferase class I/II-fold pyridoxal phosphate-dependent enzyme [Planctomycetota bacterium]MCB9934188.1 aminotransferase class I/II-fold pyridoxal phosphate-dependent enzyme [Planctomycetota bacterium]